MKLKELSQRTDVPIPTIKYYLREGLLPKGEPVGETKAEYDESHVERLRFIRVLVETAQLPIAGIREALTTIDDETSSTEDLIFGGLRAVEATRRTGSDPHEQAFDRTGADALIGQQGWQAGTEPARDQLARALAPLRHFGLPADADALAPYLKAANAIAEHQLATQLTAGDADQRFAFTQRVILASVLYDGLLAALTRLAVESGAHTTRG